MRMIAYEHETNSSPMAIAAFVDEEDMISFGMGVGLSVMSDEPVFIQITRRQALDFAVSIIKEIADPETIPSEWSAN